MLWAILLLISSNYFVILCKMYSVFSILAIIIITRLSICINLKLYHSFKDVLKENISILISEEWFRNFLLMIIKLLHLQWFMNYVKNYMNGLQRINVMLLLYIVKQEKAVLELWSAAIYFTQICLTILMMQWDIMEQWEQMIRKD